MSEDLPLKLQPLRIPPRWRVTYNIFFEVDPSPETMEWFNESMMLGILSDDGRYFIDLSFRPEDDPAGSFCVAFVRAVGNIKPGAEPDDWDEIGGANFQSRGDAVAAIEEFMHDIWQDGEPRCGD